MVLGSLIVARLKLPFVDFQRCGFRLGVLFCAASHLLYFMCCDFPDFGHKAKYAPFGMLGKPKSAVIIKGVTTPASATSAPSSSESFPWGCCRAHTGHHLPCHRHAHGHGICGGLTAHLGLRCFTHEDLLQATNTTLMWGDLSQNDQGNSARGNRALQK